VGNITCAGASSTSGGNINFNTRAINTMVINGASGAVGISNTAPLSMLHLGNCTVLNSSPVIVFGKNVNGTCFRNAFMGYTDTFFFVIGDYGNTNTSNTLTQQIAVLFSSPSLSIKVENSGYVRMQYGFGQGSKKE
jgi:hypothetical protein